MRIIKFRSWHTGKQKMFSPEEMGRDQLTIMPDGKGFINVSSDSTSRSEFMTQMIPMQFTGMKDNKGDEIYEGDILTNNLSAKKVEYSDGRGGYVLIGENIISGLVPIQLENHWIIGNIYQNQDLLK